jgi:hypothetical protein
VWNLKKVLKVSVNNGFYNSLAVTEAVHGDF